MYVIKVSTNGHSQHSYKMASVLTASNFSVDTINFGKHKPNVNGGYNIEISIGDTLNETLIQTPKMRAPFGISTDKTNPFKKSLDVSFQGQDTSESIKALRTLVEKMDNVTIDYALKNSKSFFKNSQILLSKKLSTLCQPPFIFVFCTPAE